MTDYIFSHEIFSVYYKNLITINNDIKKMFSSCSERFDIGILCDCMLTPLHYSPVYSAKSRQHHHGQKNSSGQREAAVPVCHVGGAGDHVVWGPDEWLGLPRLHPEGGWTV